MKNRTYRRYPQSHVKGNNTMDNGQLMAMARMNRVGQSGIENELWEEGGQRRLLEEEDIVGECALGTTIIWGTWENHTFTAIGATATRR